MFYLPVDACWYNSCKMMKCVYEVILRAPDGRERRQAAIIPNEEWRQDYIAKAHKNGLEIELRELDD